MKLNKQEILRYLSYRRKQTLTAEISDTIDTLMEEVQQVAQPRTTYKLFDCYPHPEKEAIVVAGAELTLEGHSIYEHLKHAQKVGLFAATLGIDIERRIRMYEVTDLTKAVILDACCTEYIEKICDMVECAIEAEAAGMTLNRRFSPGYGDLALETQTDFLRVLETEKMIGVTLSQTLLMIPRKSVSALVGLFENPKMARPRRKRPDCLDCEAEDCNYRMEGLMS